MSRTWHVFCWGIIFFICALRPEYGEEYQNIYMLKALLWLCLLQFWKSSPQSSISLSTTVVRYSDPWPKMGMNVINLFTGLVSIKITKCKTRLINVGNIWRWIYNNRKIFSFNQLYFHYAITFLAIISTNSLTIVEDM